MFRDLDRIARSTRLLALILSIAAVGGCGGGGSGGAPGVNNPPPPPPPSGGTQFTKILILGGSTAAGYQSSGISATTQRQTYGALLATMSGAPFAIPELAGSGCPAPVTTPLAAQNSAVSCSRAAALPATTTGQLAAVPQTRVGEALVVAAGNAAAFDSLFIGSRSQVQVARRIRCCMRRCCSRRLLLLIPRFGDESIRGQAGQQQLLAGQCARPTESTRRQPRLAAHPPRRSSA